MHAQNRWGKAPAPRGLSLRTNGAEAQFNH